MLPIHHRLGTRLLLGAFVLLCPFILSHVGCSAASQQTAARDAVAVGECLASQAADPHLTAYVDGLLTGGDWRTNLPAAIVGPLSGALVCSLSSIATRQQQEATSGAEPPGPLIWKRADLCDAADGADGGDNECRSTTHRAASVLRAMAKRGRVKLPPSGGG